MLLGLLELVFGLRELGLGLIERVLLHENRLGKDVERVGGAAEALLEHLLGIGILFGKLGLLHAVDQIADHVLFLGGHCVPFGVAECFEFFDVMDA